MAEGKKSQKFDRNRPWCKLYRLGNKREASTVHKLLRRLSGVHGLTDGSAVERLRAMAQFASRTDVKLIAATLDRFNSAEGKAIRNARNVERERNADRSASMRGYWLMYGVSARPRPAKQSAA